MDSRMPGNNKLGTRALRVFKLRPNLMQHGWNILPLQRTGEQVRRELQLTDEENRLFSVYPGRRITPQCRLPRPMHRSSSLCSSCPCGMCGHGGLDPMHFHNKGSYAAYCLYNDKRHFIPAQVVWSAMGFPAPHYPYGLPQRFILAGIGNAVQPIIALAELMDVRHVFIRYASIDTPCNILRVAMVRSQGPY